MVRSSGTGSALHQREDFMQLEDARGQWCPLALGSGPSFVAFVLRWVLAMAGIVAPAMAQSAFVRVNQVGYPVGTTKRAYLMSSGAETGATFSVVNSGGTSVLSASVGANLG